MTRAFLCLIAALSLHAECPYPCWTETPAARYRFVAFESVPAPAPEMGYIFTLPYPAQENGGWSIACHARENYGVDLYRYTEGKWLGPLTGPISRTPLLSYETGKASGRKGLAVQVEFTGKADSYNGSTLTDAIFFHSDPCYRASTEFGFFRLVKGLGSDSRVYFYYEVNANCKPAGKCRVHGTDRVLLDRQDAVPLATPSGVNSQGGTGWLYEAYLWNGGAQWSIHVLDPYTLADASPPLLHDVKDYWQSIASGYYDNGATGYVTATAARNGPLLFTGPPPAMNISKIWVAK